ncbi:MAG TPA: hypothetical protein PKN96_12065 [Flavobacterium sp.]|uniref:hypothetical protein n=1 Tax=Flavobacterium sp. TaxID=239 RepID=UPI002BA7A1D6|nr:hypothetical protein [Flavobacterium sp.]HNP34019.1 hypothetical protein [Flavobacterium sp.]
MTYFKNFKKRILDLTSNEDQLYIQDFVLSQYAHGLVTLGWLVFQLYSFFLFNDRPAILFEPILWFQKIFMPAQPNGNCYLTVLFVTIVLVITSFKYSSFGLRLIITLLLLYINGYIWSYKFYSNVGHFFLLSHLLKVFIPHNYNVLMVNKAKFSWEIRWYYLGLMFTYTLAGFWKVLGLLVKIIQNNKNELTWLHKDAIWSNSFVSYRSLDEAYPFGEYVLRIQPFWQIMFLLMLLGQLLSMACVLRKKYLYIIGIWSVMFHLLNIILFKIVFYVAPLILLALFLPWQKILGKIGKGF